MGVYEKDKYTEKGELFMNESIRAKIELGLIIFLVFALNHLFYLYQWQAWFTPLSEFLTVANVSLERLISLRLEGVLVAFLAWVWILLVGSIITKLFLAQKVNGMVRYGTIIAFGVGIAGTLSIILGIFQAFHRYTLILSMSLLLGCLLYLLSRDAMHRQIILKELMTKVLTFWLVKPTKYAMIILPTLMIVYYFVISYAVLAPVVHWDATVYHATMANILYLYKGFPLIVGTSHGLEMSSNYPPLFSALGAFFYTVVSAIEDVYLKIIPPIASFITVSAIYGIGKRVAGEFYGVLSTIILLTTPFFILYSIYATSYILYVAFVSLSVYFLILALRERDRNYWLISGILSGFSLLTNYRALFSLPLYLIVIIYAWIKGEKKNILYLALPIILLSSTWFLRNMFLIGDPLFPFGFINKSEPAWLRTYVFDEIQKNSIISFFNKFDPTPLDYVGQILFNRIHYPAYSFLLVIGIMLIILERKIDFYLIIAWPITSLFVSVIGVQWIFPRSFLDTIPAFSLLAALPLYKTVTIIKQVNIKFSWIASLLLILIIISYTLFPALPVAIAGKNTYDASYALPPTSLTNILKENIPEWYHGQNRKVWDFLNSHLQEGEKVATMESKLYYIKNGDPKYFFPLDGSEASSLYTLTSPAEIVKFLKSRNVYYIYDSPWTRGDLFRSSWLFHYLGSPWFPAVYSVIPTTTETMKTPTIYNVGPLPSPIIKSGNVSASLNVQGWIQKTVDGVQTLVAVSEQDDTILSDAPRIYVAAPNMMKIQFEYMDEGLDYVDVHLYEPAIGKWIHSYVKIPRENSKIWRTFEFFVPPGKFGFIVLGIHAFKTNFAIRKIIIEPFEQIGKYSLINIKKFLTNVTNPPTLMVYLPALSENEIIEVYTNSYRRNISIEIFEGIIQPWETTKWWERHRMIARVPELPTYGTQNPTLVWKAEPGIYTLLVVLWDEYSPEARVDLAIFIGGFR
jgi:4-amino-4-deoxy-L-arabinose transferase-like glycosyltransferase